MGVCVCVCVRVCVRVCACVRACVFVEKPILSVQWSVRIFVCMCVISCWTKPSSEVNIGKASR